MLASASFCCIVALGQKTITERTYWIDGDYASPASLTASVDISSLAAGLHSLTMRVQDSEGMWSSPVTKFFVIPSYAVGSTEIAERQYWLDGDYAHRTTLGASTAVVDLGELRPGLHSFTMRVRDDVEVWSSPVTKFFLIETMPDVASEVVKREYWLDGKFAERSPLGTSVAIVDLSELNPGLHSYSMRVCDDVGVWSAPVTKYFIISTEESYATELAAREYWLDGNYAERTALGTSEAIIDLGELREGIHSFTMRVKDDVGVWSSAVTRYFVIAPEIAVATEIAEREYWFDGKVAERTTLGASEAIIDLGELGAGMHRFTMRVKDDVGVWSSPITQYFVVLQPVDNLEATLTHYVYWFNDDNALAESGTLEAESGIIPVSIKQLDEGRHQISWSVGDSRGKWSAVARDSFDVVHLAVADAVIRLEENTFEYQARDIEPEAIVTNEYETLTKGEDYEVEYANNYNAGTATATVRGIGFYKDEVSTDFTITKAPLTVSTTDQVREKGEENPEFPLTYEGWKGEDTEAMLTTVPVATTVATAESPVGIYDILVGGGESLNYDFLYQGAKLTVNLLLTQPMMALAADTYEYDARDIEPELTIMDGETPLVKGTDYEVTYADNHDVGSASFTITGLGFYHGVLDGTFIITPAQLTVTADDQVKEQGQENPELTFSIEGWKGTDDESVLITLPVATTTATADSPVGTYEILVDGGEALNYTFLYVPGMLTIQVPVGIKSIDNGNSEAGAVYDLSGRQIVNRQIVNRQIINCKL